MTRRQGKDISSCWMILRKRDNTGSCKGVLCGELALEEAVDLSYDTQQNDDI